MKKHKGKILVLFLAVLLVSVMSCENPFLKKMLVEEEKGNTVPPIEGGASLILSPNKLSIQVKAVTSDGSAIAVEGCTETTLASGNSTYTVLHAIGTTVILKGKITELNCGDYTYDGIQNKLTALNVQGLTALQKLDCSGNQLTALNMHGLTALQVLWCRGNRLTELNVQGCTALRYLGCWDNQLTELNVQGLTALRYLDCWDNQLNADAFKKLFDDLPQRADSDNAKCLLYTERIGVTEGNHTDFTAPPDLAAAFDNAKNNKKWKMYKRDAYGYEVEL